MALIDSAVIWPDGKIYFFRGNEYFKYDIANERVEPNYPRPIAGNWPGLDTSIGGIQGAIVWPELVGGRQKAYFFSRDRFYSYDVANDQVDGGSPMPTQLTWRGVLGGSQQDHHIDVALQWPNGKVYLFQEDKYYRITDRVNKQVDEGYPLPILGNWQGLGTTGQPLTAAFVWPKLVGGRQKAYFFHQSIYMRYDIGNDKVDEGYPLPIQGNWQGL